MEYWPPHVYRERVWELLYRNALVGNLKPEHIKGSGLPDAIYHILREELLKGEAGCSQG